VWFLLPGGFMKRHVLALLALSLAGICLADELRVSAAASLTDALDTAGREYSRKSGEQVVFNFGASSSLARQIDEGAPADVFISADELKMDDLARHGRIFPASRRILLSNTLVIIVPRTSRTRIRTAADLTGPSIRKLALAQTESVPAGIYARTYLQKLHLWDRLEPKIVPTENVRAALAAVASENADAGIVYRTDALISNEVRVAFEVPVREGPEIAYPVAVVADSPRKAAAQRFIDYLRSPAGTAIFRRYGFLIGRER
jgi:molybdate transport system substrate-binding protein